MGKVSSLYRWDVKHFDPWISRSNLAQILVERAAKFPVGPFSDNPFKTHRSRRREKGIISLWNGKGCLWSWESLECPCFWQGGAWVQPLLWLGIEAASWVAVHLLLAWDQDRCSVFPPASLHWREQSQAPTPSPPLDDASCGLWCVSGLENKWTYSGSNQFFSRGVSAQRVWCVGDAWLVQPDCRVDTRVSMRQIGRADWCQSALFKLWCACESPGDLVRL